MGRPRQARIFRIASDGGLMGASTPEYLVRLNLGGGSSAARSTTDRTPYICNKAPPGPGVAVHHQKTSGQDPAIKKGAQLPFHEPGHQPAAFPLPSQKGLDRTGAGC